MLTTRFVNWFNGLPIVGQGERASERPFGTGTLGFVFVSQVDEANLMYVWVILTVPAVVFTLVCAATGDYAFGSVGSWIGLAVGIGPLTFIVTGLILHGARSTLLSIFIGRAKLRASMRKAPDWERDVTEHEPQGLFRWLVTWRDADFVVQAAAALVALVLQLAAGP